MTTLALVPAVVVAMQVPLLGPSTGSSGTSTPSRLPSRWPPSMFWPWLCGWYPARLASAVQPADALRYE